MSASTIKRSESAYPATLQIDDGTTGLSPTVAVRDPQNPGFYLDFADNTFKSVGWTTRKQVMTEVSAANSPGTYQQVINLSTWVSFTAGGDHVIFEYEATVGGSPYNVVDEVRLDLISDYADDAVWYDGATDAGQVVGLNGTRDNPCDDIDDAIALANATGLRKIKFIGFDSVTPTSSLNNITIEATGDFFAFIDLNSQTHQYAAFIGCAITNITASNFSNYFRCSIGVSGAEVDVIGFFHECQIQNDLTLDASGAEFHRCTFFPPDLASAEQGVVLDVSAGNAQVKDCDGVITLRNWTATTGRWMQVGIRGRVSIEANCTGTDPLTVHGGGKLTNLAPGGANVDTSGFVSFDEMLSNHLTSGTIGEALAVLFGFRVAYVLDGGSGVPNATTDTAGLLTSARVRVFDTPANASAATPGAAAPETGELATIAITGTATTPGRLEQGTMID